METLFFLPLAVTAGSSFLFCFVLFFLRPVVGAGKKKNRVELVLCRVLP